MRLGYDYINKHDFLKAHIEAYHKVITSQNI